MAVEGKPALAVADPAPLGLGGFALTTFVLSAHNAGWAPDIIWIGLALFYGGAAQFLAGMWEFKNKNTFGATAFSTYGAFWFSLATFVLLQIFGKGVSQADLLPALGWFVLAFAIFNTYMMFWSTRTNTAVFLVFLTLEITEILLFIGFFSGSAMFIHWGGYIGVITALVAWYTSAAGVINSMSPKPVLPVGGPMW
ncbi:MAG TPA: acetate uptake transporter [bacterium]|nr:acetate uptake transporter [bacterium]